MKSIKLIATDSTAIISAVLGSVIKRKIFLNIEVCKVTTKFNVEEVKKHLPKLAKKRKLALDALQVYLDMLLNKSAYDKKTHEKYFGLEVYEKEAYNDCFEDARKRIRDPKDVDLLALALKLQIPVWSDDKDFESAGIEWYTTDKLVEYLEL